MKEKVEKAKKALALAEAALIAVFGLEVKNHLAKLHNGLASFDLTPVTEPVVMTKEEVAALDAQYAEAAKAQLEKLTAKAHDEDKAALIAAKTGEEAKVILAPEDEAELKAEVEAAKVAKAEADAETQKLEAEHAEGAKDLLKQIRVEAEKANVLAEMVANGTNLAPEGGTGSDSQSVEKTGTENAADDGAVNGVDGKPEEESLADKKPVAPKKK